jgi:hypothetical protein
MGEMLWKRDTQGEYQAAGYTIYQMQGSGRWRALAPGKNSERRTVAVRETLCDAKRAVAEDVPLSCDIVPLDGIELPIPHDGELARYGASGLVLCRRHAIVLLWLPDE